MTTYAAIVLAGGIAQRFQTKNQPWQDKALVEFEGKPLLIHVIQNLLPVTKEIVVSVNDTERKAKYLQVLESHGLNAKFVVDQKSNSISGPVVAIMSGLDALSADYCLTVPVDMPFLKPQVANFMLKAAEGFDLAVPMWPDGTTETLLMALEQKSGLEITKTLFALNKSRADSMFRAASTVLLISPLKEITALDPKFSSFININQKEDLTKLKTRNTEGSVKYNIALANEMHWSDLRRLRNGQKMLNENNIKEAQTIFAKCTESFEAQKNHFWAAISAEKLAQTTPNQTETEYSNQSLHRAAKNYQAEAKIYQEEGCRQLATQALADKEWCESKIKATT